MWAPTAQEAWSANPGGQAQNAPDQDTIGQNTTVQSSPWLAMPTVTSDPKLGTSPSTPSDVFGAYLHYFDKKSRVSKFGAAARYTSRDSRVGGVFAKTSLV